MRNVLVWFVVGLVACSLSPREPELNLERPDRLQGIAAPPGDLEVTLRGGALGGDLTTEVTGANAGDFIYLARTSAGTGDGPCFSAIGGACLGLVAPLELHGSLWTDADGAGDLTVSIPERADWMGRELCFQAIVRRGAGGDLSEVSDAVCVTLDRDSDGDGSPDSSDPCPDDDTDACVIDEWVFGDYEGGGTTFEWATQYNGSFSCSDTCALYGAEATGARWVCNHWDGGSSEGCGPDNHGEWTDDHCSEQILDGVYEAGSNPACGSESMLRDFVDGTGSEGWTWHALECQCAGGWDDVDPDDDDPDWDDVDPGAYTGSEPGWFFSNYDGLLIPFDPAVMWNGTISCPDTCGAYALEAVGARFVCNLHGSGPTEGCDDSNEGLYGDANCGWMVRDGVALTENGNTEDCAGGDIMGCVTGSCSESVTYHSLECQCE